MPLAEELVLCATPYGEDTVAKFLLTNPQRMPLRACLLGLVKFLCGGRVSTGSRLHTFLGRPGSCPASKGQKSLGALLQVFTEVRILLGGVQSTSLFPPLSSLPAPVCVLYVFIHFTYQPRFFLPPLLSLPAIAVSP